MTNINTVENIDNGSHGQYISAVSFLYL